AVEHPAVAGAGVPGRRDAACVTHRGRGGCCASFLRQWPPERFGSLDQSHVAELRGVAAHVVEFVGKVPDAVAGRKRCERQSGQYTDRATLLVQEGTPRITGDPRCECVRAVVPAMTRAAEAEPLL